MTLSGQLMKHLHANNQTQRVPRTPQILYMEAPVSYNIAEGLICGETMAIFSKIDIFFGNHKTEFVKTTILSSKQNWILNL